MKKTLFTALTLGLAFTASLGLASDAGHGAPAGAKTMTAAEAMKTAVAGNDEFKKHHDSHYFDAYQTGQAPSLTVIGCSDSRVHTDLFGIDPHNNIFMIRNIGNQLKTAEGSVDYGVRHLPTRVLLILGHSSCGAIKAAMGDYSGETAGIRSELDSLKPVIAGGPKGDFNLRWAQNVERNVDYQVKEAMKLYADKVKAGELTIVGGIYDFNNVYGKGRGTLVVTNIGGETNLGAMVDNPVMKDLAKAQAVTHVGSIAPAM